MKGYYARYLEIIFRFLPFAIALLRDRRRYLLFGPPRRVSTATHRVRAERMTAAMLDLGPAFVKVGQVLSTRPDVVPPTYTEVFATLQDEVPEGFGGDPRTVLEEELADVVDLSAVEPIAGGSLAYVYTAPYEGERIALKVRRPGVKRVIERDLRVIDGLIPIVALFADERQQYSLENVVEDFETIILDELDFEREARLMGEIRDNLADEDRIVIPAVYEHHVSTRVLPMEYVPGTKITDDDAFASTTVEKTDIARLIARTYLKMGLVDGVFHADPHPGNLSLTDDGRLIIYDFGMSEHLTPTEQDDIATLYRALVRRDVDDLLNGLIALEVLAPSVDRVAVRAVLELVIETLEGRSDITWRLIITELMTMLHDFPFRIPPDVMLLIRVGTVGEGVCRSLDPEFDFIEVTREFLHDYGFIESESEVLLEDVKSDLRASAPVVAGLPARVDRVFGQLERGELVVRTTPTEPDETGDPALGYAILAGAAFVATAILAFHDQPYEGLSFVLGVAFFGYYVYARLRVHG